MKIIVAVDGPAGAGKGTVSKALAKKFNLAYMDTGTLYRAVAYLMISDNINPDNKEEAVNYAKKIGDEVSFDILKKPELRTSNVGINASKVSSIPEVRKALFDCQVNFANNISEGKGGSILDGRDIGTVICPDANVKLFITASAEVRAKRRYAELIERGEDISFDEVLIDIKSRDRRDSERANSPLKPAEDAVIINTGHLSIEEAINSATNVVLEKKKV